MALDETLVLIFGGEQSLNPAQECARAALILVCGWGMIRFFGRRAFGRWSALDIVVSIVVGSNLSRALTGNAPLWGTLLATAVIFGLHQLLAMACAARPRISHLVEGHAIKLVEDGRPIQGAFLRTGVSEADLHEALRQSGMLGVEHAQLITLEPSGKITLLKQPSA